MAATADAWSSGSSTTTAFWRRSGRRSVETTGARARRLSGVPSNATLNRLASRGVMSVGVPRGGDALAMLRAVYGPVSSQAKSLVAAQAGRNASKLRRGDRRTRRAARAASFQ